MRTIAILLIIFFAVSCGKKPITDEELIISGIQFSLSSKLDELIDLRTKIDNKDKLKIRELLYIQSDTACRLRPNYISAAAEPNEEWRKEFIESALKSEELMPSVGVARIAYEYTSVLGDRIADTAYMVVRSTPASVFIAEQGDKGGIAKLLSIRKGESRKLK